jgi:hypothetical protein
MTEFRQLNCRFTIHPLQRSERSKIRVAQRKGSGGKGGGSVRINTKEIQHFPITQPSGIAHSQSFTPSSEAEVKILAAKRKGKGGKGRSVWQKKSIYSPGSVGISLRRPSNKCFSCIILSP